MDHHIKGNNMNVHSCDKNWRQQIMKIIINVRVLLKLTVLVQTASILKEHYIIFFVANKTVADSVSTTQGMQSFKCRENKYLK